MADQRIRLGGVAFVFRDRRLPAPAGARRLRSSELRALLAAHRDSPALRRVLAPFERQPLEHNRHHRVSRDAHSLESRADALACYQLRPSYPRLTPATIPDAAPPSPAAPFEPNPMFDEQDHWIEVEVIGEDDEAVAGVVCEITLPNGKTVRRTTNHLGLVRIERVSMAGPCSVVFPELDKEAWERA